jgi:hypothetical protein
MRLCVDASGPNGFPCLELAEVLGVMFLVTSYAGAVAAAASRGSSCLPR